MLRHLAWVLPVLVALGACAHGRYDAFEALSPEAKAEYAKYRQFMTEHQRERYLHAPSDGDRHTLVRGLHVEARLAKWPAYVQEAVWTRQVVVGMDEEAVILSVGPPDEVLREDDPGRLSERVWLYRSPEREVHFVEGRVREVRP